MRTASSRRDSKGLIQDLSAWKPELTYVETFYLKKCVDEGDEQQMNFGRRRKKRVCFVPATL